MARIKLFKMKSAKEMRVAECSTRELANFDLGETPEELEARVNDFLSSQKRVISISITPPTLQLLTGTAKEGAVELETTYCNDMMLCVLYE